MLAIVVSVPHHMGALASVVLQEEIKPKNQGQKSMKFSQLANIIACVENEM